MLVWHIAGLRLTQQVIEVLIGNLEDEIFNSTSSGIYEDASASMAANPNRNPTVYSCMLGSQPRGYNGGVEGKNKRITLCRERILVDTAMSSCNARINELIATTNR